MKLLGFVFLLFLVFAVVGYSRGWFSITAAHAGATSELELTIDDKKLGDDARAITGQRPAPTNAETSTSPADRAIDGVLTVIDVAARNLTLRVGGRTVVQHVPTAVAIARNGESLGMEDLLVDMRTRLVFDRADEPRGLVRIEVLR